MPAGGAANRWPTAPSTPAATPHSGHRCRRGAAASGRTSWEFGVFAVVLMAAPRLSDTHRLGATVSRAPVDVVPTGRDSVDTHPVAAVDPTAPDERSHIPGSRDALPACSAPASAPDPNSSTAGQRAGRRRRPCQGRGAPVRVTPCAQHGATQFRAISAATEARVPSGDFQTSHAALQTGAPHPLGTAVARSSSQRSHKGRRRAVKDGTSPRSLRQALEFYAQRRRVT